MPDIHPLPLRWHHLCPNVIGFKRVVGVLAWHVSDGLPATSNFQKEGENKEEALSLAWILTRRCTAESKDRHRYRSVSPSGL